MTRRGDRLFAETLNRYDEHHALVGRKVSVVEAGSGSLVTGKCTGLDSTGRLDATPDAWDDAATSLNPVVTGMCGLP